MRYVIIGAGVAGYAAIESIRAVDSAGEIKPGAGAVIRRGLTKVAVYCDEQGALHERSAVCPHLGGIVHWNDAEKTWDCPCHGSRFDRRGGVLSGPANRDLSGVDSDCEKCVCDSPPTPSKTTDHAEHLPPSSHGRESRRGSEHAILP